MHKGAHTNESQCKQDAKLDVTEITEFLQPIPESFNNNVSVVSISMTKDARKNSLVMDIGMTLTLLLEELNNTREFKQLTRA